MLPIHFQKPLREFARQIAILCLAASFCLLSAFTSFADISSIMIVGKGSPTWWFLRDAYHNRQMPYTETELREISESLKGMAAALRAENIRFVLFIAPDKEEIHAEYLPDNLSLDWPDPIPGLVDYLHEYAPEITVVYPKEELLAAKSRPLDNLLGLPERSSDGVLDVSFPNALYYEEDEHWNALGGYVGADALIRVITGQGQQDGTAGDADNPAALQEAVYMEQDGNGMEKEGIEGPGAGRGDRDTGGNGDAVYGDSADPENGRQGSAGARPHGFYIMGDQDIPSYLDYRMFTSKSFGGTGTEYDYNDELMFDAYETMCMEENQDLLRVRARSTDGECIQQKIYLAGDSFRWHIMRPLMERFSESTIMNRTYLDLADVLSQKPDVFVLESLSRMMHTFVRISGYNAEALSYQALYQAEIAWPRKKYPSMG